MRTSIISAICACLLLNSCSYKAQESPGNIFDNQGKSRRRVLAELAQAATGVSWNYTKDSLRYELESGPVIRFIDRYYRFPNNLNELYRFDCQTLVPFYTKCQLRRIYKKMSFNRYGTDSCVIRGGYYGEKVTSVIYNTPMSYWSKFYSETKEQSKEDRLLTRTWLLNKYHPSFFDFKGELIVENSNEISFESALSLLINSNQDRLLRIKTPVDTSLLRIIYKYTSEEGLTPMGFYPSKSDIVLNQQGTYSIDKVGTRVEDICSIFLEEVIRLCDKHCDKGVDSIIFQTYLIADY